jgi:hypothetical protein
MPGYRTTDILGICNWRRSSIAWYKRRRLVAIAVLTDREMSSQGADLLVVDHSHADWVQTFRSAAFLSGPSNYLLAMTKRMIELQLAVPHGADHIHVTRGDGDGRIHLA